MSGFPLRKYILLINFGREYLFFSLTCIVEARLRNSRREKVALPVWEA